MRYHYEQPDISFPVYGMWALKMKPLKREVWETCFDHCPI